MASLYTSGYNYDPDAAFGSLLATKDNQEFSGYQVVQAPIELGHALGAWPLLSR